MATTTMPETEMKRESKASVKYVYFFGGGKAEGNGKMKDDLGGKGAGLAEMTNAGLPVPPGFTIQTEACREYMRQNTVSREVDQQMEEALAKLEQLQGQKLGQGENGERAFRRQVFNARHDGHYFESRSERQKRSGTCSSQQE